MYAITTRSVVVFIYFRRYSNRSVPRIEYCGKVEFKLPVCSLTFLLTNCSISRFIVLYGVSIKMKIGEIRSSLNMALGRNKKVTISMRLR